MGRRWLLLLVGACGCADILGLGDFNGPDGSMDTSVPDVATEASGDAASDVTSSDADADAACTTGATVDDTKGIFVAVTGSTDSTTCGTETVPCASVQTGLNRASVISGKSIVYVSRGTYKESLTLYPGLTLEGGWDILDNGMSKTWVQACTNASDAVIIQSPTADATVTATNLGGTATLTTLTIESKSAAASGESLYGVFAGGATTTVVMTDVIVKIAAGGTGPTGATGGVGAPAVGSCVTPGDAGTGATGPLGIGADAGMFAADGWAPSGNGTVGGLGATGADGLLGPAGPCYSCGSCQAGLLSCTFKPSGSTCGGDGYPGCGGGPGTGGGPGGGGGSSIGVYAWDATVVITRGSIQVGSGGAGGMGGAGGLGGAGSGGATGDAGVTCITSCGGGGCTGVNGAAPGGDAGGAGGLGGTGGTGGGGAGGCSYAIVQGGDGGVTTATTTLAHAEAGAPGGPDGAAGAPGSAGDRWP